MRWSESAFELLLTVGVGITLWNLLVVGAGKGVFVDVGGTPLTEGRAASIDGLRESSGRQPAIRLGAARSVEATRPFSLDRAMLELVTRPEPPHGEPLP